MCLGNGSCTHEDAVAGVVGVELVHQRQQLGLGDRVGEVVVPRGEAELDGRLLLRGHVDLRRGVFAHAHHGDPRCSAVLRLERLDLALEAILHLRGQRLAIDDLSRHTRGM
jgi:hypothetical protein